MATVETALGPVDTAQLGPTLIVRNPRAIFEARRS
jgi:hypothetical protein